MTTINPWSIWWARLSFARQPGQANALVLFGEPTESVAADEDVDVRLLKEGGEE